MNKDGKSVSVSNSEKITRKFSHVASLQGWGFTTGLMKVDGAGVGFSIALTLN